MTTANPMRAWLNIASKLEREHLASLASTTVGNLYQIAGSYRNDGTPRVRSGLARRLEQASKQLRRANRNLPELIRTDLAVECRECEFALKCLGTRAVASDFVPVVPEVSVGAADSEGGEP